MKKTHLFLLCILFMVINFLGITSSFTATTPISIIPEHSFYIRNNGDDGILMFTFRLISHMKSGSLMIHTKLNSGTLTRARLEKSTCDNGVNSGATGCVIIYTAETPKLVNPNVEQSFSASLLVTDSLGYRYPAESFGVLIKAPKKAYISVVTADNLSCNITTLKPVPHYFKFTVTNNSTFDIKLKTHTVPGGNLPGNLGSGCDNAVVKPQGACIFTFTASVPKLKDPKAPEIFSTLIKIMDAESGVLFSEQKVTLKVSPPTNTDLIIFPLDPLSKSIKVGGTLEVFRFIAINKSNININIKSQLDAKGNLGGILKDNCKEENIPANKSCIITFIPSVSTLQNSEQDLLTSIKIINSDTGDIYSSQKVEIKVSPSTKEDFLISSIGSLDQKIKQGTQPNPFKFSAINKSNSVVKLTTTIIGNLEGTVTMDDCNDGVDKYCLITFTPQLETSDIENLSSEKTFSATIEIMNATTRVIYSTQTMTVKVTPLANDVYITSVNSLTQEINVGDSAPPFLFMAINKSVSPIKLKTEFKATTGLEGELKGCDNKIAGNASCIITFTPSISTLNKIKNEQKYSALITISNYTSNVVYFTQTINLKIIPLSEKELHVTPIGEVSRRISEDNKDGVGVFSFSVMNLSNSETRLNLSYTGMQGSLLGCDKSLATHEFCTLTFTPFLPTLTDTTKEETFTAIIKINDQESGDLYSIQKVELTVTLSDKDLFVIPPSSLTQTIKEGTLPKAFIFTATNKSNADITLTCTTNKDSQNSFTGCNSSTLVPKTRHTITFTPTVPTLTSLNSDETLDIEIIIKGSNDKTYYTENVSLTVIPLSKDLFVIPDPELIRTIKEGEVPKEFRFTAINQSTSTIKLNNKLTITGGLTGTVEMGSCTAGINVNKSCNIIFTPTPNAFKLSTPSKEQTFSAELEIMKLGIPGNDTLYYKGTMTLNVTPLTEDDLIVVPVGIQSRLVKEDVVPDPFYFTVLNNGSSTIRLEYKLSTGDITNALGGSLDSSNCDTSINAKEGCFIVYQPLAQNFNHSTTEQVFSERIEFINADNEHVFSKHTQKVNLTVMPLSAKDIVFVPVDLISKEIKVGDSPGTFQVIAVNRSSSSIKLNSTFVEGADKATAGSMEGCTNAITPGERCTITFTPVYTLVDPKTEKTFTKSIEIKNADNKDSYFKKDVTFTVMPQSINDIVFVFIDLLKKTIKKGDSPGTFRIMAINTSDTSIKLKPTFVAKNSVNPSALGTAKIDCTSVVAHGACNITFEPKIPQANKLESFKIPFKIIDERSTVYYEGYIELKVTPVSLKPNIVVIPEEGKLSKTVKEGDVPEPFHFAVVNEGSSSISLMSNYDGGELTGTSNTCPSLALGDHCVITFTPNMPTLINSSKSQWFTTIFKIKDANKPAMVYYSGDVGLTVIPKVINTNQQKFLIFPNNTKPQIQTIRDGATPEPFRFRVVNQGDSTITISPSISSDDTNMGGSVGSNCENGIEPSTVCTITYTPDKQVLDESNTQKDFTAKITISVSGSGRKRTKNRSVTLTVTPALATDISVLPVRLNQEIQEGAAKTIPFRFIVFNKSNFAIAISGNNNNPSTNILFGSIPSHLCGEDNYIQANDSCSVIFTANVPPLDDHTTKQSFSTSITFKSTTHSNLVYDTKKVTLTVTPKPIAPLPLQSLNDISVEPVLNHEGLDSTTSSEHKFLVTNTSNHRINITVEQGAGNYAGSINNECSSGINAGKSCAFEYSGTNDNSPNNTGNLMAHSYSESLLIKDSDTKFIYSSQLIHRLQQDARLTTLGDIDVILKGDSFRKIKLSVKAAEAETFKFKLTNTANKDLKLSISPALDTLYAEIGDNTNSLIESKLSLGEPCVLSNKRDFELAAGALCQITLTAKLPLPPSKSFSDYLTGFIINMRSTNTENGNTSYTPLLKMVRMRVLSNHLKTPKDISVKFTEEQNQEVYVDRRPPIFSFDVYNTLPDLGDEIKIKFSKVSGGIYQESSISSPCENNRIPESPAYCSYDFTPNWSYNGVTSPKRFSASFSILDYATGFVYSTQTVSVLVKPRSTLTITLPVYKHGDVQASVVPSDTQKGKTWQANSKNIAHRNRKKLLKKMVVHHKKS